MLVGYVLAESMRPGSALDGLPLKLRKVERIEVEDATPDQPSIWTMIRFEFPEDAAERVATALADVLQAQGGWYANFDAGDDAVVIFAGTIFRYRRRDKAARSEAEAFARSVGVPESQLDW